MSSTSYVSLVEAASLELAGAKHRLELAIRAHQNFLLEYGTVLDGTFVYRPGVSAELRASLDHELATIQTELDTAHRLVRHCEESRQKLELKKVS
jgi:hypothetical protein